MLKRLIDKVRGLFRRRDDFDIALHEHVNARCLIVPIRVDPTSVVGHPAERVGVRFGKTDGPPVITYDPPDDESD